MFLRRLALVLIITIWLLPDGFIAKRVAWYQGNYYRVSTVGVAKVLERVGKDKVRVEVFTYKKRKERLLFVVDKLQVYTGSAVYTYLTPDNELKYCLIDQNNCLN